MGSMVTRKLRELTEDDIRRIADTVEAWQDEGYEDIPGFCKAAGLEDIKKNDYILTPGRYVGLAEEEEDAEAFEDKMERLTSELGELFKEGDRLQEEVKKQLKSIGWEV